MSDIPYCDETLPVVTGCSKVSPGCANCWAERISQRFKTTTLPWTPENAAQNVVLHPENLDRPLHWRRPRTVFVCATSDLFHEQVPAAFIDEVFTTMALAERHTFLLLTKRAARMHDYLDDETRRVQLAIQIAIKMRTGEHALVPWPLPNVFLGVTAENQRMADERIPLLLDTPAAHRWASLEPLLGPVDLRAYLGAPVKLCGPAPRLEGIQYPFPEAYIEEVVVGGEAGPGYRPMDLAWVQNIKAQCDAAGVAWYGKQQAGPREGILLPGRLGERAWPS